MTAPLRSLFRIQALCCAALWTVAGCDGSSTAARTVAQTGPAGSNSAIAARTADSDVELAEVEAPIAMRLYDLEREQYALLRDATEAAVIARLSDGNAPQAAELNLTPPAPPELPVEADPARIRGSGADDERAPVTVLVYCNFESPHCARLQTRLDVLQSFYGDVIEIGVRDFILPFHRDAGPAAMAARCALEQDAFWPFHDALYAVSGPLDRARLERAAAIARVDGGAFEGCLSAERTMQAVREESSAASQLGLSAVPAVFVNGLYAGLEPQTHELIWLVERELTRLDVESPRDERAALQSEAPLRIEALLHSAQAGQGLALAVVGSNDAPIRALREGDRVAPNVWLQRITAEGIQLLHGDVLKALALGGPSVLSAAPASGEEEALVLSPHVAVPVTLDRGEVLVRLAEPGLLEALEPLAPRDGDYRLLRIRDVAPGSLYELLGFEPRDVVLLVNEQNVNEADNPLWRALEQEREVRVRVLRSGGLAKHFTFRFED
jgi:protein-disulfide isomerase